MDLLNKLEKKLDKIYNKNLPELPKSAKQFLIKNLPWISLISAIAVFWASYDLWNWGQYYSNVNNYFNNIYVTYGVTNPIKTNQMTLIIWVALIVYIIEGLFYFFAFKGLTKQKKSGWNMLFYGLLCNVVYGIILIFTNYGNFGSFLGYLIVSAIAGYFIFQIRSAYVQTPPKKIKKTAI